MRLFLHSLCLTLLALVLPASAFAEGDDEAIKISSVEELKAFRDAVNKGTMYSGQVVKLTADLDLSGEANWTPIGNLVSYPGQSFDGTFDGDGHIISNLTVNDNTPNYAVAGLFGSVVNGTVKNLTLKNVNITSTHYAGAIVAYTSNKPTITNCHVIGGTITSTPELVSGSYDNGDKVGGIIGYCTAGTTISNCSVEGVTITAYRDLGGIAGYAGGTVTDCTVKDVTVVQDNTNAYKDDVSSTAGAAVGGRSANAATANTTLNTIDNVTVKSVTPAEGVAKYNGTAYETLKEALDAAAADDPENIVIDLLDDATLDVTAWSGTKNALAIGTANTKTITINGDGHTLTFNHKNSDWNNVATNNDEQTKLILNNMSITNSGYNNSAWNRHDINFNCAVELNDVTSDKALAFKNAASLNNVTVNETGSVYAIWIQTNGQTVDIDGLTVNAQRGIKIADQYATTTGSAPTLNVKNATFNTTKKAAILVTSTFGATITAEDLNIDNAKADTENAVWVDEDLANLYGEVKVTGATVVPEGGEAAYAASISAEGNVKGYYKTLTTAIAAAEDGQTVTLHSNCAGDGVRIEAGKFSTGLTVDFGGFTYTVDGETVGSTGTKTNGFQLLKNNNITFKNGTITSEKALILIQNYSNLTLEGMTLTLDNSSRSDLYTLSNNNGAIVINGSTINANTGGGFAFDVCRYSNYPSVNVTVKGESVINGDIEIYASASNAKDGFGLKLESGKITGEIVVDATAAAAIKATPEKAVITKAAAFEKEAPAGYEWKDNGDGTSTLVPASKIELVNNGDNSEVIAAANGRTVNVVLKNRTLYKDGAWNTVCLPFDYTISEESPLAGAIVKELDTEDGKTRIEDNVLYLVFKEVSADADGNIVLKANVPYLIKWESGDNISSPEFEDVTIVSGATTVTSIDNEVQFVGTLSTTTIDGTAYGYLGNNNKLLYAKKAKAIYTCRAYFYLPNNTFEIENNSGVKSYVLSFGEGDDELTAVSSVEGVADNAAANYYDLQGRKLNGAPTAKGIYVLNGKKVFVK